MSAKNSAWEFSSAFSNTLLRELHTWPVDEQDTWLNEQVEKKTIVAWKRLAEGSLLITPVTAQRNIATSITVANADPAAKA